MQERSQLKINVAPRREAKRGKEEGGNRQTSERPVLRPVGSIEGESAPVSAPANGVKVRQKPEQALEVSQERGREGAGRTVIGVEVGGTAKEKTEKPVNSGFERTAAQRTELAERTVRVERTADVHTRVVRTAMEGASRSEPTATRGGGVVPPGLAPLAAPPAGVPPETRVRV
ncbi:hypothetical protein, partial [Paenibacillus timonensis]|uniref:hypothetical protein n=1 Tax=Paenibacillus timonensis TaxID=225915 RepID=UPI0022DEC553